MPALSVASHLRSGIAAKAATTAKAPTPARSRLAPPPAAPSRRCRHPRQHPWTRAAAAAAELEAAPAATAQEQEELALLESVVEGTELAGAHLALAYDAQRDGWSADAFHARVDRRGPALVVALTGGQAEGGRAAPGGRRHACGLGLGMAPAPCPVPRHMPCGPHACVPAPQACRSA